MLKGFVLYGNRIMCMLFWAVLLYVSQSSTADYYTYRVSWVLRGCTTVW